MATGQKGRAQAPKLPSLWDRLEAQIAWYDRKASANQRAYKWSKIAIIVLAISLPIFAEYGHIGGSERAPAFLVGLAAAGGTPTHVSASRCSRCSNPSRRWRATWEARGERSVPCQRRPNMKRPHQASPMQLAAMRATATTGAVVGTPRG